MKYIIFTSLVLILSSCNGPISPKYRDAPTQFVIINIQPRNGMKELVTYEIEVIDANDLVYDENNPQRNLKFWFCDTAGKYKLGQPILFDKRR